jgi:hypothetical protein
MNIAYELKHITRNDLNKKLDINKVFHNHQGNIINVDNILYSFGKKDRINKNINKNNILYAYWGYNGSNKIKDSFNKNGNYDCYQDVTRIVKENIESNRNMISMKYKFKDPLHGIEKRLFIKLKIDTQKYINELKSLKYNIQNIVNSFDNEIKNILTIILNNGNSKELSLYKNKLDTDYERINTEIEKIVKILKESNISISSVEEYSHILKNRIIIFEKLITNETILKKFYQTVNDKERLENIQIHDEDYIFEGNLRFIESNSTIIEELYKYSYSTRSYKDLFKKIFECFKFNNNNNNIKVLKINKYMFFGGSNHGLIDDQITTRLNIEELASLENIRSR